MAKNPPPSTPASAPQVEERQADLRLVNLISRGVSMKDAKKQLGIVDEPLAEDASDAQKALHAKRNAAPLGAVEQDLL